ncbi:hypothetical protein [Azohydromonas caseinilytica]|uniref:DEAD/DEAH box helicase n=1 Tax=Azohydromonas caseinilytica TaxID=2728836 RepID=A0A848FBV5_9BURK|nr:hypothetical protein [Azohydromonas caseinilytica]NML15451.1 DEAD/DEAH box helicase [Azohydromonas caseinilytica]
MDVLLAHQRAGEDDSKYIRSSFHGLDPQLRSVLDTTLLHASQRDSSARSILAVVVCPTPARLQDALESLNRCAGNHQESGGDRFPIRFAACTSHAPHEVHERLRLDPPQLLLTDAATLDRWLMGWAGPELRDSLLCGLRVLACLGDAHDRTGLQAAELALLVRRYRMQCRHALSCIGNPEPPAMLHPEPLRAHLHALTVSEVGWPAWPWRVDGRPSLSAFVEESQPGLPLRPELRAALRLAPQMRDRIHAAFEHSLRDLPLQVRTQQFDHDHVEHALDALPQQLDQALDRWRALYRAAYATHEHATYKLQNELLSSRGKACLDQQRRQDEAARQLRWLRNACSDAGPEFDPAHFLAAEGFLPSHGVRRQPLRVFLSSACGPGQFISRPRATALHELGPLALLHHEGRCYRLTRFVLPDAGPALTAAKLCRSCGCLLEAGQRQRETCPVCGVSLSDAGVSEVLHDLLEVADAHAEEVDAPSPADEAGACGFDIDTCFSIGDGHTGAVRQAWLKAGGRTLLDLGFIPGARLVQLNRGWRGSEAEGFPLDLLSGTWCPCALENASTPPRQLRRVRLRASYPADVLLLLPAVFLGLEREGVLALQDLLLRAIGYCHQLGPGELGAANVGQGSRPGILLHETEAGGAGVLSRLLEPDTFSTVIKRARSLRRSVGAVATAPDRNGSSDRIDDALDRLCRGSLEQPAAVAQQDYAARYARLLKQLDPAAPAARRFIEHLYARGLRLPDVARQRVDGLYVRPDFHYAPRAWIFCDDLPDGELAVREADEVQREALLARGDEVWVWHAGDDLAERVAQRPDLFGPVR